MSISNCDAERLPSVGDRYLFLRPNIKYDHTSVPTILKHMRPSGREVTYLHDLVEIATTAKAKTVRILSKSDAGKASFAVPNKIRRASDLLADDAFVAFAVSSPFATALRAVSTPYVVFRSDWDLGVTSHAMLCLCGLEERPRARIIDPDMNGVVGKAEFGVSAEQAVAIVCEAMLTAILGQKCPTTAIPIACSFRFRPNSILYEWNKNINVGSEADGGNCQWVQLFAINTILCGSPDTWFKESSWKRHVDAFADNVLSDPNCAAYHFEKDEKMKAVAFMKQIFIRAIVSHLVSILPQRERERVSGKGDKWVIFDTFTMRATPVQEQRPSHLPMSDEFTAPMKRVGRTPPRASRTKK